MSVSNAQPGRRKVLVLEDEPEMLCLYEDVLAKIDCKVLSASDMKEALRTINENKDIELMILDLSLPALNGLVFLNVLRKQKILDGVPVFISSGFVDKKAVLIAVSLGAKEILTKPFDSKMLLAKAKQHMGIA